MGRPLLLAGLGMAALAVATTGSATVCAVPSASHPTVQAAISDLGCSEIVLAAQTFVESPVIGRSLTLRGSGSDQSFIQGRLEVSAGTVSLEGLHLAAAGGALSVHSGAEVSGFDLVALEGDLVALLFADGFETGDLSRWSASTP